MTDILRKSDLGFFFLSLLVCFFISADKLFADSPILTNLAKWQISKKEAVIVIELSDHLSTKQKSLINSGFSTYSEMEIFIPKSEMIEKVVIFQSKCTVKFDTWEEIYNIIRLDKSVEMTKNRDFKSYANICLTAKISNERYIKLFTSNGGLVKGVFKINQISSNRSAKIREWLIKQQSGVMKGLFSHMLGDIKLIEEIEISIRVPPLASADKKGKPVIVLYPESPRGDL